MKLYSSICCTICFLTISEFIPFDTIITKAELERSQNSLRLKGRDICSLDNDNQPCRKPSRGSEVLTIINPPGGTLFEAPTTIVWSAFNVPDEVEYRVTLESIENDTVLWTDRFSSTEVTYPSDTVLEPGGYYKLIVELIIDGDNSSPEEVRFEIIDDTTKQEIENKIQEIESRNLAPDQEVLAIAELYQEPQYELIQPAIEVLNNAINNNIETVEIYLMLGDIYFIEMNAYTLAENAYRNAINLADRQNNYFLTAEAQAFLGQVLDRRASTVLETEREPIIQEALTFFESAYSNYIIANDRGKAAQAAEFLGEIYKSINNYEQALYWYRKAEESYRSTQHSEPLQRVEQELSDIESSIQTP